MALEQTEQLSEETLGPAEFAIRILSGDRRGEELPLRTGIPFIIGSSVEATLALDDEAVSRQHLELMSDGIHVHARDLGSTNGSLFEGQRFSEMRLGPGAVVKLGRSEVQIVGLSHSDPIPPSEQESFGGLIGRSSKMRRVFAMLERAVRTNDGTVLLSGETGTGKEVAADAIHQASSRKDQPLIVVDCASIPPNLIESELFGHVRGAYTHAHADRPGVFETADGGTIFLDEIGELPMDLQPRLLRVLESRTVKRVGSNEHRKIDVRVVAATNRDLEREVQAGRFRKDLFFRLSVHPVVLPPLRERRDDIPHLARHFIEDFKKATGKHVELTPAAMASLMTYDWPGNVRELKNVVQQAFLLSSQGLSIALQLAGVAEDDERQIEQMIKRAGTLGLEVFYALPFKEAKKLAIEAFELGYIGHALQEAGGNVSKAAEKAGLHRNMLHRIMAREK